MNNLTQPKRGVAYAFIAAWRSLTKNKLGFYLAASMSLGATAFGAVTFSPNGGSFAAQTAVTITGPAGSTLTYTLPNGVTINTSGNVANFELNESGTISVVESDNGAKTTSAPFTITTPTPPSYSDYSAHYIAPLIASPTPITTWQDMSGNGWDLTNNGVGVVTNDSKGIAVAWTSRDFLASKVNGVLNTNDETVALRIDIGGVFNNWGELFDYAPAGTDRSPGIWLTPNNTQWYEHLDPGNIGVQTASLPMNQSVPVVAVQSNAVLNIYINGSLANSVAAPDPKYAGDSAFMLGGVTYPAGMVHYQEVGIWNKALTASEAAAWSSAGPNPGPVTFSPNGGTFSKFTPVTLTSAPGTTITYTMANGLQAGSTTNIVHMSMRAGGYISAYTTMPGYTGTPSRSQKFILVTAAPTITETWGGDDTNVTIAASCSTPLSTIYWSTNGTATTNSAVWTQSLVLTNYTILSLLAKRVSWESSSTQTIVSVMNPPSFSNGSGTYTNPFTATINDIPFSTIRYKVNGGSWQYGTEPVSVQVSSNTTITAQGIEQNNGSLISPPSTVSYNFATPAPVVTQTWGGDDTNVTIAASCSTPLSTIYWSTNGTATTNSAVWTQNLVLTNYTVLSFLAKRPGWESSRITQTIVNVMNPPSFSNGSGTYTNPFTATINDIPTSTIRYKVNGGSWQYGTEPVSVQVSSNTTITAQGIEQYNGSLISPPSTVSYNFVTPAPVVTQTWGGDDTNVTIAASCSTPLSTIYWSTNGTATTNSAVWTQNLVLTNYTVLSFLAKRPGWESSRITQTIVNVMNPPSFSNGNGSYANPFTATINDIPTSTIRYKVNGRSWQYGTEPVSVQVSSNTTITAQGIEQYNGSLISPPRTVSYYLTTAAPTITYPTTTGSALNNVIFETKTNIALGTSSGTSITYQINGGNWITVPSSSFQLTLNGMFAGAPTSGEAGYWPLNGNTVDDSGNNHNGTLVNNPTWGTAPDGSAISLNGTDQYVGLGTSGMITSPQFTISAWIYRTAGGGTFQPIAGEWDALNTKRAWIFLLQGNTLELAVSDEQTKWIDVGSSQSIPMDTWLHVTGEYNAGSITMFVNGKQIATYIVSQNGPVTGVPATTGVEDEIGSDVSDNGGHHYFSGKINEVAIYNRLLSASEVGNLAQQTPATSGTIRAYASRPGWSRSVEVTGTYTFQAGTPHLTQTWPTTGVQELTTVANVTSNTTTYYAINTIPTTNSTVWNNPGWNQATFVATYGTNATVKAIATRLGYLTSAVGTTTIQVAPRPTASLEGGYVYNVNAPVTLTNTVYSKGGTLNFNTIRGALISAWYTETGPALNGYISTNMTVNTYSSLPNEFNSPTNAWKYQFKVAAPGLTVTWKNDGLSPFDEADIGATNSTASVANYYYAINATPSTNSTPTTSIALLADSIATNYPYPTTIRVNVIGTRPNFVNSDMGYVIIHQAPPVLMVSTNSTAPYGIPWVEAPVDAAKIQINGGGYTALNVQDLNSEYTGPQLPITQNGQLQITNSYFVPNLFLYPSWNYYGTLMDPAALFDKNTGTTNNIPVGPPKLNPAMAYVQTFGVITNELRSGITTTPIIKEMTGSLNYSSALVHAPLQMHINSTIANNTRYLYNTGTGWQTATNGNFTLDGIGTGTGYIQYYVTNVNFPSGPIETNGPYTFTLGPVLYSESTSTNGITITGTTSNIVETVQGQGLINELIFEGTVNGSLEAITNHTINVSGTNITITYEGTWNGTAATTTNYATVVTVPYAASTIHYTTDGTTPTAASPVVPATITHPCTIQMIGMRNGYSNSPMASITIQQPMAPGFSYASGSYASTFTTAIGNAVGTGDVHYRINSGSWVDSGASSVNVNVAANETIDAYVGIAGGLNSATNTADYTFEPTMVNIFPNGGTVHGPISVSLRSSTAQSISYSIANGPWFTATGNSTTVSLDGIKNYPDGTELEAYYPMDGSPQDVWTNGLNGSTWGAQTWPAGEMGSSLQLTNGLGMNVAAPLNSNFTLSFWANADTYVPNWGSGWTGPNGNIIMVGGQYLVTGFRAGFVANTGNFTFWTGQNGGNLYLQATSAIPPGQWALYTVTYDGTTARLYINGTLNGSQTGVFYPINSSQLGGGGGVSHWAGRVDDLRIYNTALNAAQVQEIYHTPQTGNGTINVLANHTGWNSRQMLSRPFTFQVATPVLTATATNNGTAVVVSATDSTAGSTLNITGGKALTPNSVIVTNPATITAYGTKPEYTNSAIATINVGTAQPTVSTLASGTYTTAQTTKLTTTQTTPFEIHYQINGSNWRSISINNISWSINNNTTIKTYTSTPNGLNSVTNTYNYTLQMGAPTISARTGTNYNEFPATISAAGASDIRYEIGDGPWQQANTNEITVPVNGMPAGPNQDGLIGNWQFDEGIGSITYDTSESLQNAALNGTYQWIAGKNGSGLYFPASAAQVGTAGWATLGSSVPATFTLGFWVKPEAFPISGKEGVTFCLGSYLNNGCLIGFNSSGNLYVGAGNSGGSINLTAPATTTNTWVHYTLIYNATAEVADLYMNGTWVGQQSGIIKQATTGIEIEHGWMASAYWMNGAIDDVQLYNRALPSSDVLALSSTPTNNGAGTIRAYADKSGWTSGSNQTASITFQVAPLNLTTNWTAYHESALIKGTSATAGAKITYEVGGYAPTITNSTVAPTLTNTLWLGIQGYKANYLNTEVAYVQLGRTPEPGVQVGTNTSPVSTWYTPTNATITTASQQTTLYYTTDGTWLSGTGTTTKMPLTQNCQLRAFAVNATQLNSLTNVATYTFAPALYINPPGIRIVPSTQEPIELPGLQKPTEANYYSPWATKIAYETIAGQWITNSGTNVTILETVNNESPIRVICTRPGWSTNDVSDINNNPWSVGPLTITTSYGDNGSSETYRVTTVTPNVEFFANTNGVPATSSSIPMTYGTDTNGGSWGELTVWATNFPPDTKGIGQFQVIGQSINYNATAATGPFGYYTAATGSADMGRSGNTLFFPTNNSIVYGNTNVIMQGLYIYGLGWIPQNPPPLITANFFNVTVQKGLYAYKIGTNAWATTNVLIVVNQTNVYPTISIPIKHQANPTLTIKAYNWSEEFNMMRGPTNTITYTFEVPKPTITEAWQNGQKVVQITGVDTMAGAAIHYTTNGTPATGTSPTVAPLISQPTTVNIIATANGWADSQQASIQIGQTPAPILPAGQTFSGPTTITIKAGTNNISALKYSTNGVNWVTTTANSVTIPITQNTTVEAYETSPGDLASTTASQTYQVKTPAPTLNPPSGTFYNATTVTLSASNATQIAYSLWNQPWITAQGNTVTIPIDGILGSGPTNGLVGYWPFQGNTLSAGGTAGNAYVGPNESWPEGIHGQSLHIAQGVVGASIPTGLGSQFTLAFWAKYNTLTTNDGYYFNMIMAEPSYLVSGFRSGISPNADGSAGNFTFWTYQSGGNIHGQASISVPTNVWAHYTVTYDGTNFAIYVNGKLGEQTGGTFIPSTASVGIGSGAGGVEWIDGEIADVKVFNRAVTPSEVQELAGNTTAGALGAIRAYAVRPGYANSTTQQGWPYTFIVSTPTPTLTWATNHDQLTVGANDTTTNSTLRYTEDGSIPSTNALTVPVTVTNQTMIRIAGLKPGYRESSTVTVNPNTTASPIYTPDGGNWVTATNMTITDSDPTLAFMQVNVEPLTKTWTKWSTNTVNITVGQTETVNSYAVGTNEWRSQSKTRLFSLNPGSVAISPNGGSFTNATYVTITAGPEAQGICYNLGTGYQYLATNVARIVVNGVDNGSGPIEAFAVRTNWTDGPTNISGTFTFTVAKPTISVASQGLGVEVTGTDGTTGATLAYAMGATPTPTNSTLPALVMHPGTLNVIAYKQPNYQYAWWNQSLGTVFGEAQTNATGFTVTAAEAGGMTPGNNMKGQITWILPMNWSLSQPVQMTIQLINPSGAVIPLTSYELTGTNQAKFAGITTTTVPSGNWSCQVVTTPVGTKTANAIGWLATGFSWMIYGSAITGPYVPSPEVTVQIKQAGTPTFNPLGYYANGYQRTLYGTMATFSTPETNSKIMYKVTNLDANGNTLPSSSLPQFSQTNGVTMELKGSMKIEAWGQIPGEITSSPGEATYLLKLGTPQFYPNGGAFENETNVTISIPGATTIYYQYLPSYGIAGLNDEVASSPTVTIAMNGIANATNQTIVGHGYIFAWGTSGTAADAPHTTSKEYTFQVGTPRIQYRWGPNNKSVTIDATNVTQGSITFVNTNGTATVNNQTLPITLTEPANFNTITYCGGPTYNVTNTTATALPGGASISSWLQFTQPDPGSEILQEKLGINITGDQFSQGFAMLSAGTDTNLMSGGGAIWNMPPTTGSSMNATFQEGATGNGNIQTYTGSTLTGSFNPAVGLSDNNGSGGRSWWNLGLIGAGGTLNQWWIQEKVSRAYIPTTGIGNVAQANAPTLSQGSGTFYSPTNVVISTTEPSPFEIRYTVDGKNWVTSGTNNVTVPIGTNTTLTAYTYHNGKLSSHNTTATYTFVAPKVTLNPGPGTLYNNTNLVLRAAGADAIVYKLSGPAYDTTNVTVGIITNQITVTEVPAIYTNTYNNTAYNANGVYTWGSKTFYGTVYTGYWGADQLNNGVLHAITGGPGTWTLDNHLADPTTPGPVPYNVPWGKNLFSGASVSVTAATGNITNIATPTWVTNLGDTVSLPIYADQTKIEAFSIKKNWNPGPTTNGIYRFKVATPKLTVTYTRNGDAATVSQTLPTAGSVVKDWIGTNQVTLPLTINADNNPYGSNFTVTATASKTRYITSDTGSTNVTQAPGLNITPEGGTNLNWQFTVTSGVATTYTELSMNGSGWTTLNGNETKQDGFVINPQPVWDGSGNIAIPIQIKNQVTGATFTATPSTNSGVLYLSAYNWNANQLHSPIQQYAFHRQGNTTVLAPSGTVNVPQTVIFNSTCRALFYKLGNGPWTQTNMASTILHMTLDGIPGNTGIIEAYGTNAQWTASAVAQSGNLTFQVGLPSLTETWNGNDTQVTIAGSTITPGATLHYTLSGGATGTSTAPITLSSAGTVTVVGTKTNYEDSADASLTIPMGSTPIISPAGGTFNNQVAVNITDSQGMGGIQWTPGISGMWLTYYGGLSFNSDITIGARYHTAGQLASPVVYSTYHFQVGKPSFVINWSADRTSITSISGTTITAGATLGLTTDGTTPTNGSPTSVGPITGNTTVKLMGFKAGYANSLLITTNIVKLATPTLSVPSGVYYNDFDVTVTTPDTGATWEYSLDGGSTWLNGTGPVPINGTETTNGKVTLMVRSTRPGALTSATTNATYALETKYPYLIAKTAANRLSTLITYTNETAGVSTTYRIGGWPNSGSPTVPAGGLEVTNTEQVYVNTFKPGYITGRPAIIWVGKMQAPLLSLTGGQTATNNLTNATTLNVTYPSSLIPNWDASLGTNGWICHNSQFTTEPSPDGQAVVGTALGTSMQILSPEMQLAGGYWPFATNHSYYVHFNAKAGYLSGYYCNLSAYGGTGALNPVTMTTNWQSYCNPNVIIHYSHLQDGNSSLAARVEIGYYGGAAGRTFAVDHLQIWPNYPEYSINGGPWTEILYTNTIPVDGTCTVQIRLHPNEAQYNNGVPYYLEPVELMSGTTTYHYNFHVAEPNIKVTWATNDQSVSISGTCGTVGATLHYTTDGSVPTASSPTLPATITSSEMPAGAHWIVSVVATKANYTASTIWQTTITKCANPTITPNGGNYTNAISTSISNPTDGTLHYRIGNTPWQQANGLSTAFNLDGINNGTGTIEAYATWDYTNSGVVEHNLASDLIQSGVYNFYVAPIELTPPDGTIFTNSLTVKQSCGTIGTTTHISLGPVGGGIAPTPSLQTPANTIATNLGDTSFETPVLPVGGFSYGITGTPWTFSNTAGIESDYSAWGAALAPDGSQAAMLQMTGTASQPFNINTFGSLKLTFKTTQRGGYNPQTFEVDVDGQAIGTYKPASSGTWTSYTNTFTTEPGTHTLEFKGLDIGGGDRTAFLDAIQLTTANNTATWNATTNITLNSSRQIKLLGTKPGYFSTAIETWTYLKKLPNPTITLERGPGEPVVLTGTTTTCTNYRDQVLNIKVPNLKTEDGTNGTVTITGPTSGTKANYTYPVITATGPTNQSRESLAESGSYSFQTTRPWWAPSDMVNAEINLLTKDLVATPAQIFNTNLTIKAWVGNASRQPTTIYYDTNGVAATTNDATMPLNGVKITNSVTFNWLAVRPGWTSERLTRSYTRRTILNVTPSQTFTNSITVTASAPNGLIIYAVGDEYGDPPNASSYSIWSGSLYLTQSATVEFIVVQNGKASTIQMETYTDTCTPPTFTPDTGGTQGPGGTVVVESPTAGSDLTIKDSGQVATFGTNSIDYGPILGGGHLTATASKRGWQSATSTSLTAYTGSIPVPQFSPNGATGFTGTLNVTVQSGGNVGMGIRVVPLDKAGTNWSMNYTNYATQTVKLNLTGSARIEAFSMGSGNTESTTSSAVFEATVPTPIITVTKTGAEITVPNAPMDTTLTINGTTYNSADVSISAKIAGSVTAYATAPEYVQSATVTKTLVPSELVVTPGQKFAGSLTVTANSLNGTELQIIEGDDDGGFNPATTTTILGGNNWTTAINASKTIEFRVIDNGIVLATRTEHYTNTVMAPQVSAPSVPKVGEAITINPVTPDSTTKCVIDGMVTETNHAVGIEGGSHTYQIYAERTGWITSSNVDLQLTTVDDYSWLTNTVAKTWSIEPGYTCAIQAINNNLQNSGTTVFFHHTWVQGQTDVATNILQNIPAVVSSVGNYTIEHQAIELNNGTLRAGAILSTPVSVTIPDFTVENNTNGDMFDPNVVQYRTILVKPTSPNITDLEILNNGMAYDLAGTMTNGAYVILGNVAGENHIDLRYMKSGTWVYTSLQFKTLPPQIMGRNGNSEYANRMVVFPAATYMTGNNPADVEYKMGPVNGSEPIGTDWTNEVLDPASPAFNGGIPFNNSQEQLWLRSEYDLYQQPESPDLWTNLPATAQ